MQAEESRKAAKDAKPYPSERAMVAAIQMEVHCTIGSKTVDKARALDARFPAYDEMLAALTTIASAPQMTIRPKDGVDEYKDDYLQTVARAALSKTAATSA